MTKHTVVVLFYKYFQSETLSILRTTHEDRYMKAIHQHQYDLCSRLGLRGRVLLSSEGINGTVSAETYSQLKAYMSAMEAFELMGDCSGGSADSNASDTDALPRKLKIFSNIDWKESKVDNQTREPFPDLKISVVKEIVSTGGALSVDEIPKFGGQHLTPREFHDTIQNTKDVVLIDVRNTFECDVGHFVNPHTGEAAIDPNMVTFSSFDATFCAKNADKLKDKKVLMYCTGGIRCVKASAMLKKRGVQDVSQLQGGIHRYLEEFGGEESLFKGKNFVFDQRVALGSSCEGKETTPTEVVGSCIECKSPFDEISGSRLCTVCRDLVLVCPRCQQSLREYHCRRHATWKQCYFTFLEVFTKAELVTQKEELTKVWQAHQPPSDHKNVRRTLKRQMEKVQGRIDLLSKDGIKPAPDAPKRCRTCMETNGICDGNCFGFWKHRQVTGRADVEPALPVMIGDMVGPGPHWNPLRLGEKSARTRGKVVEVKSWATEGDENDCVAVIWEAEDKPLIYRWGFIARNGKRMYDVQKVL